ncbi:hypothetical protein M422DRAFT_774301 [Sphaerobolus stellatus SS14]|nr:hypothetical protein M422DRAFT_774301 [Sphaerobolus stellatus SS14]
MKIANRTFIVSGGSSGLGLATVQTLLSHSANVTILDLSPPPSTLSPISSFKYFKTDISNEKQVEIAVEETVKWSKETGKVLGGVICAAGVGTVGKVINASGSPHSLSLFRFTQEVNVIGTFNLARLACKHLIEVPPEGEDGERGIVIMISSVAAFEALPSQTAYAASKGAIRSMTLPMARDLGRYGIRVNTIAPGTFESGMTDKMSEKMRQSLDKQVVFPRRFGRGEEFAETVKWMIECAFVNGETIRLSGAGRLPGKL